jgi:hypothetical protein
MIEGVFRNGAWFRLIGYVNSKNNRLLTLIYEVPLHYVLVDVLCAVRAPGLLDTFIP